MKKTGVILLCALSVFCPEKAGAAERMAAGAPCMGDAARKYETSCLSPKKNKPKKRQTVSEKIVSDIRVKQAENSKKLEIRLKINQLRTEMWSPGRQGQRTEYERQIRVLEKALSGDNG
ncbi:hypothetical protein D6E36_05105 [Salmonella enterica]|nr:hypothetical protein [Salmonella enterica]ECC3213532.1 hypothetical protein [Salmonella enterica subsp. diarizonae]EDQ3623290.1 hypothetical protein [Salmonella enterica subsp. diarizonae]EIY5515267.1 hypothetical protein [Salmonella enterica]EKI4847566.1 hypothetical protein [Salmonella enterica]